MGRKKQQKQHPVKPLEFHSTPFSTLKGLQLPAVSPAVAEPSAPAPKPDSAEIESTELFLRLMEGVRKLDESAGKRPQGGDKASGSGRPSPGGQKAPSPPSIDPAAADMFLQEIGRLKLEVKFTEQLPDEDELEPLSGNRVRQLKRGIISVDRQLDLHGLTRDEALSELPRFLRSARQRGQAAALIITGKGLNSPGEPVLQRAVAGWLRDAGRELVVEFAPAPREMGGNGAFVVFLRPLPKPSSPAN